MTIPLIENVEANLLNSFSTLLFGIAGFDDELRGPEPGFA
jgi:hypothetical protein